MNKLDHALRVLAMIERIDNFKELDLGWCGDAAAPISKAAISNAKMACLLVSPESLANLGVFPSPDGEVQFENMDERTLLYTVTCSDRDITIAAVVSTGDSDGHEITFKADFNWHKELEFKVCTLFQDALAEKGIQAKLFFRCVQWRSWRSAKKWFKRITGQTVPTDTVMALAFEDGRLICADTVAEFANKLNEVINE